MLIWIIHVNHSLPHSHHSPPSPCATLIGLFSVTILLLTLLPPSQSSSCTPSSFYSFYQPYSLPLNNHLPPSPPAEPTALHSAITSPATI